MEEQIGISREELEQIEDKLKELRQENRELLSAATIMRKYITYRDADELPPLGLMRGLRQAKKTVDRVRGGQQ